MVSYPEKGTIKVIIYYIKFYIYLFTWFWVTPNYAQSVVLSLLRIILNGLTGQYGCCGLDPLVSCKQSLYPFILPTVQSLFYFIT